MCTTSPTICKKDLLQISEQFDSFHVVGNKRTALATNQHDVTAGGTYHVILTTIFHHDCILGVMVLKIDLTSMLFMAMNGTHDGEQFFVVKRSCSACNRKTCLM